MHAGIKGNSTALAYAAKRRVTLTKNFLENDPFMQYKHVWYHFHDA
jgi:hypothetical protein